MKLIFVPGLLGDYALWEPVIQALQDTYVCDCIDIEEGSSIQEIAHDINLNAEKGSILIGFSLGGWIALQACLMQPNFYQGLILVSSTPGNLKPEVKKRFSEYIAQINSGDFLNFIKTDLEKDVFDKTLAFEKLMKMKQSKSPVLAVKQLNMMLNFEEEYSSLVNLDIPLLFIRGEKDESVNAKKQDEMVQKANNVQLELILNVGHYIPLENPQILAKIIRNIFS